MDSAHDHIDDSLSEMEVVDTFTRLIFGETDAFAEREMAIVQALREADDHVSLDSLEEMGVYLRALGVKEMISLVSRVRRHYPPLGQTRFPVSPGSPVLW